MIVNTTRRALVWLLAWTGFWIESIGFVLARGGERVQEFAWSIERWDQP